MEEVKKEEEQVQEQAAPQLSEEKPTLSVEEVTTDVKESVQESAVEETKEQKNWRVVREKREQDKREKEEAQKQNAEKDQQIAAYKKALEDINSQQAPDESLTKKEKDKIIADLIDDDIPNGADIKNFLNDAVPKIVSSILESRDKEKSQVRAEKEQKKIPQKLQSEHQDFQDTVVQENLDYLDYHYPEVSGALAAMPHSFDKWSRVYKTIKKLVPSSSTSEVNRIEKNSLKPQSMTSSASQKSTNTTARALTDSQKAENWKRLQALARE